ncbi:MAG: citrate lyase acyl carrier protein [Ignavibacteriaceae bacterium]|jgi:citrate lyase subunit beta/citryl-CoA lyase
MKNQKQNTGSAGRIGPKIRSDCFVQVSITTKGGINIDLKSKVKRLYGNSINSQVIDIFNHFGIENANVSIEDQGAVPFVIAARVEAAIKRIDPQLNNNYFLDTNKISKNNSKDRLRRTRLYLPGNEPHYFINAALHKPDCIILDLEDSVAYAEKDAARILVRNALVNVNFCDAEKMVRINPLPLGYEDLQEIVPHNVQTILIPKCESAAQVIEVDNEVNNILAQQNIGRNIFLIPIIESALGIVHAFEIASASKWNCGLAIGLEDYTADIGVERTKAGNESLFARSSVINSAKAAGIQALDSVFSDINDDEGLLQSTLEAKSLGFDGKGCIHPRQIKIIHDAFVPTEKEIEYSQRIVNAFDEAQRNGLGVVALGSKMIDAPVVKRAQRILSLAKSHSKK